MTDAKDRAGIDALNDYVEPAFYLGLNKSRKLPAGISATHTLNSFEYRLKESPNDLSCHLQRIQFSISTKNRAELFSSICDLFIVLGGQGLPLRQHLFSSCKKALTQEQVELLENHIEEKHLTANASELPNNCFFKKESIELIELKSLSQSENEDAEDVLHIAESYIENSQFDTAMEYMQTYLEQEPENRALTLKLISLYKALNCTEKFQSAYKKFSENVSTSLYWNDAKQHFLKQ